MKKLLVFLLGFLLSNAVIAQTVGKTTTENYKASFETKVDISQFLDYLKCKYFTQKTFLNLKNYFNL